MDCSALSDKEIITKIKSDKTFFKCLVEQYETKLRRYVIRLTGSSKEEADEILQESFIKVYRNINDFDLDMKLQSWIYRITHNQAIDTMRKIAPQKKEISIFSEDKNTLGLIEKLSSNENLGENFESRESLEKVIKIINNLKEPYRDAAILRFLEEKDYEEISDILQKSVGSVGSLVNRARKKIIDTLKKSE